tara:strand:- start:232 stop:669 length:438 start_codon:yes stop_codon:yes gene_type:complete
MHGKRNEHADDEGGGEEFEHVGIEYSISTPRHAKKILKEIDLFHSAPYDLSAYGTQMFQNRQEDHNRAQPESLSACNKAYLQSESSKEARVRSEHRRVQNDQSFYKLPAYIGQEDAGREKSSIEPFVHEYGLSHPSLFYFMYFSM